MKNGFLGFKVVNSIQCTERITVYTSVVCRRTTCIYILMVGTPNGGATGLDNLTGYRRVGHHATEREGLFHS